MSDIFISYAADDRDRVLSLVQALEKTGWTIFWDRTIPAGKTWRQRMDAEIQTCRSMVVVWTQKSVNSEWVMEEAEIGKRKQILVPVLFDEGDPPFGFGLIQAANLVGWNGSSADPNFGRLVSDIEIILGAAPAKRSDVESCPRLKEEPEHRQEAERSRQQPFSRSDEEAGRSAKGKRHNVSKDRKNDREDTPPPFPTPGRSGSLFLRVLITSATKSATWFKQIAGTFISTLIVSVIILVISEISLGWHFAPAEVSVIVMVVWLIVVAVITLRSRSKRKPTHATD